VTLSVASTFACVPSRAADTVPVTVDNFVRAQSNLCFGGVIKDFGFGKIGSVRPQG